MIKPRGWQKAVFNGFAASRSNALVEASVGAGKTIFAALAAAHEIKSGAATFVVFVAPQFALKDSFQEKALMAGLEVGVTMKENAGRPTEYDGVVVTYAHLPNLVATFEQWRRVGERLFFVFDEIHHCAGSESKANVWGAAAEACARVAERVLSMSGTPFRNDGRQISFVRYEDGVAKPDYRYLYSQAVADGVCRPVTFMTDDGIANYTHREANHQTQISGTPDEHRGMVNATIFAPRSEFLDGLIAKADHQLDMIRITDPDAGCLVVCRPGFDDDDDRHMLKVASRIEELTGHRPETISHEDRDASAKIERFKKGRDKYLVAVRMVSEGIDIPRLRVLVMATAPQSEMLFRQIVGRIVRQEDADVIEESVAYIAKFPDLAEFAQRFQDEADAGLKKRKEREKSGPREVDSDSQFVPIGATHMDGGAVAFGERFEAREISIAEDMKAGDPLLSATPLHVIAHIIKKSGIEPSKAPSAEIPKQKRKLAKRSELSAKLRQWGAIRKDRGSAKPFDATPFWRQLHVRDIDDLCDNRPEHLLDQALVLIDAWIAGVKNERAA